MVVEVSSADTSVDCSRCANRVPKSLGVRVHKCDRCGLVIDRDYNASLNIKQRGLQQLKLPQELREVTPVEILSESMKQEETIGHPIVMFTGCNNKKGKSVIGSRHMQDRPFAPWALLRHIQRKT